MSWNYLLEKIGMILTPTPSKESVAFWIGALILAQLVNIVTPDEKLDYTKSQSYLWLVGPLGFLAAAVSVYKGSSPASHWLFNEPILQSIAKYIVDLIFGISFGLVVTSLHSLQIRKNVSENFSKWVRKLSFTVSFLFESAKVALGKLPRNRVMPIWDRFTPDSQIKVLELYLKEMDNERDRQSLKAWSERKNDTEENGFNFRVSLEKESLSKLKLQSIQSKDYLGVEFWKKKDGSFQIRTTDSSQYEPREFKDASPDQRSELEPHISYWYSKMN